MSKPDAATLSTWRGLKAGALQNAICERLHTLVDGLNILGSEDEQKLLRGEIAALLECHRDLKS